MKLIAPTLLLAALAGCGSSALKPTTDGGASTPGAAGTSWTGGAGTSGDAGTSGVAGTTGAAGTGFTGAAGSTPSLCIAAPAPRPDGVWTNRTPDPVPSAGWPALRRGPAMVYDAARKKIVLYGGVLNGAAGIAAIDTWELEPIGLTWKQLPAKPPSVYQMAAVTYDGARARMFLFGGDRELGDTPTDEIWEWDGSAALWSSPATTGGILPPPPQRGAVAAYDPLRRRIFIQGIGANSRPAMHTWNPQDNTWAPPVQGGPHLLSSSTAFVWDACRDRGVFFGGWRGDETWEWEPATNVWRERLPVAGASWPSPRAGASLVFDTNAGRVLLFGGEGNTTGAYFNALWQWDGATGTWTLLSGSVGVLPTPRAWAGAAFDSDRQRLVIFGGAQPGPDGGDLWEWQRFQ